MYYNKKRKGGPLRFAKKQNIDEYVYEDFELIGYEHHPHIAAPVAV